MDTGRGVDVLKLWLMQELERMCVFPFFFSLLFLCSHLYSLSTHPETPFYRSSVKPETIASYVIALLKHQNSRGELKSVFSINHRLP